MLDPSPFAAPGSAAECRDCLLFALGREEYALDMSQVEAICGHLEVRPQAGAAAGLRGIARRHGAELPIFDLRACLGLPRRDAGWQSTIVVVRLDGRRAGLMVDGVRDVQHLPPGHGPQRLDLDRLLGPRGESGQPLPPFSDSESTPCTTST